MGDEDSARELIERALARPVSDAARATWGFTNRTDIVTLDGGERVVVQRYRRRADAEYRLRMMRGLRDPAVEAGIRLPQVRESSLDSDPAWVVYERLPGVPVPEAGEAAPGGPRFPQLARAMGELLAAVRRLPSAGLQVNELWADPERLARSAASWADQAGVAGAGRCIAGIPALFAGRPAVLAHGDFAPVNVLTDGTAVTGLLDFEAVRLGRPALRRRLVGLVGQLRPGGRARGGLAGLPGRRGPGRGRAALRRPDPRPAGMLEQLASGSLEPGIARIVTGRLHATLSLTSPGAAPPSP